MQTGTSPETLPIEAGDAEWVADLFDTVRAGDLDAVVDQLDGLVRVMRRAGKARRMLASVEPSLLRQGLLVCNRRAGATR